MLRNNKSVAIDDGHLRFDSDRNMVVADMSFDELNRMQERAFALGEAQFDWNVRGRRLLLAMAAIREKVARGSGNSPQDSGLSADLAVG